MRKKKFYLIGIAGVAMASLAGLLKKKGYEVAGSDQEMYPPMSDMLRSLKIPVFTPYNKFHVKRAKPDVVVVGNAIGRGNPELEYVLSKGQSYRSMSNILLDEFITDKKSIVITGTHGKTTTTALVAWILERAGLDPTVFVGGLAKNFNSSFKLGGGDYIVLEGDEYDTAFFDKSPKFWHYHPFIGLVNNIELDHVDIYKDFDAYQYTFARFINLIPENGLLAANFDDKNVVGLVNQAKARFHMKRFGLQHGDYTAKNIQEKNGLLMFNMFHTRLDSAKSRQVKHYLLDVKTQLIGKHNVSNILGAITVAKFLKIPTFHVKQAIETFQGVKRRAEIIGKKNGVTIIDDYAHHPTAVRETLDAIRERFHMKHNGRLICIFEPGSASSKRRVFEKEYVKSFSQADIVYIYKPFHAESLKQSEVFNGNYVSRLVRKNGVSSQNFEDINKLLFHMKHNIKSGDVIVIMSCRGFDNLYQKIWDVL